MPGDDLPAGCERFVVGRAEVVCRTHVAGELRAALRAGTVMRYAETHPRARALVGRGVVYAVPLPGESEQVVVRHNRHGGLLAPLTRDLFRAPTRAPVEMRISEQLLARGIGTPVVLAYVIYDAPAGLKRADVLTREVPDSHDLSAALMAHDDARRATALAAAADLVRALSAAGARHADLNVKNILLHGGASSGDAALEALVLDVDRVTFVAPAQALELNLARLRRSAERWRARHGAPVTEGELDGLAASARAPRSVTPLSTSS